MQRSRKAFIRPVGVAALAFLFVLVAHLLLQILAVRAQAAPAAVSNGDVNGDQRRDVSDAIYLLNWLFLGGREPVACAQEAGACIGCDPATGNVSIGTSESGYKLYVHMEQTGNYAAVFEDDAGKGLGVFLDGTSRGLVSRNSDSSVFLGTAGDSRGGGMKKDLVILEGTGFVGIGTENPKAPLDVEGTIRCRVMEIEGGGDVAEPFPVADDSELQLGMVVVIDAERPGELRLSKVAYDSTVAGVISGANGLTPGVILRKTGTAADGKHPVALTGRVWCICDATENPIKPGDLLTTSNTYGHAMKAADARRASGAVLGKAMSTLHSGKGLVLVLVSLQ